MSSSPDHEMSDSSRSSQSAYEFHMGSPPQQVPELTNHLTGLSFGEKNGNLPHLVITEQPQNHFRFRYVSEMVGTHGCLLGKSYAVNKTKTHPSVELKNFKGRALIRCQLAQNKCPDEHPHKLLEEEQDRDVSYIVPERGSYRVGFAGMGIIHTAKKDVADLLFRKYMDKCKQTNVNTKELKAKCETIAKSIDLNIVRLKFSAYDAETGKEICEPVFSEPIHNMKSASTNDLKICRMSRVTGRPKGGDDVFIFVEKVNKKNIQVWFYEEDDLKNVIWQAQGNFIQSDVHHQYGIVFRTPAYVDLNIATDVKVNVKLVRPTDGRSSEPKQFTYKADPTNRNSKKRKATSSYSSLDSSSGSGSINSICNIPTTVLNPNPIPEVFKIEASETFQRLPAMGTTSPSQCDLGDAFMESESSKSFNTSPMWGQSTEYVLPTETPQLPHLQLDSTELNKLLDTTVTSEEKAECLDYLSSLGSISELDEITGMNFMRSLQMLQPDSGRFKNLQSDNLKKIQLKTDATTNVRRQNEKPVSEPPEKKETDGYSAFYRSDHGLQVKKLVNELYELMSNKSGYKKQTVRDKLEKLFNIRLSNGDTFLHMTLCSNQPSFKNIVKIINSVNMSRLFDYYNDKHQTVLHIAIAYEMPKIVTLLIANGCNPMMKDLEGETAIHYAARSQSCLEPLMEAIDKYKVKCDVNVCNDENQTALHLCSTGASARLLVSRGAACSARDSQGRLPLHVAAYDHNLQLMQALLEHISPTDVDVKDDSGNTALQIVCDGPQRENATAMVKLLLEKMADPLKHEPNTESAWFRARDKPDIRDVMKWYMTSVPSGEGIEFELKDDIKSEPEDEDESADEGLSGLPELSLYEYEVSAALDYSGGWRELAAYLQLDNTAWFSAQPSAARTLLKHIKECRELTSQSLALILQEIGEIKAANIIKRYIE